MIRPTTPPNPQPPLTKPTRSTTAPVKAHRHHISHHSHRVHRHHHDKSVPQTAIQPTISNPFGDFLARSTSRIDGSKTPPRPQQQQQQQIEAEAVKELQAREEAEREKEREKWAVVERMRARRKAVDGDLRTTLVALSTLSATTTRRLDYTYYSLLSSVSSLTSTLSSLATLSTSITALHTHFASESTTLSTDTSSQIAAANTGLETQARRTKALETRMREGRKKVKGLGNRLDRVREKVKASEVRLREREKRVGRRLKMLWISCGVWMGILVVLAMMRQWRSGVVDVKVMHSQNKTLDDLVVGKVWGYRIERARNHGREDWRPEKSIVTSKQARTTAPSKSGVGTEATLRLFDEL